MKVLIVEDSEVKAATMTASVEAGGIHSDDVRIVPDAVSAREAISSGGPFDLVLLDLQIPNRFGDKANRVGGTELIRWMAREPGTRMCPHILAVTGFDLEEEASLSLTNNGISVLKAEPSQDGWKAHITGLVKRIAGVAVSPAQAEQAQSPWAVLLTAVDVEYDQAKRVFGIAGAGETIGNVVWHRASVQTKQGQRQVVVAKATHMGMPAAAILALKAIQLWRPRLIMQVGICAGVKGEVEMGDLIIPETCWDWGSGKLGADGMLKPAPHTIEVVEIVRALVASASEAAPLAQWMAEWASHKPTSVPRARLLPAASGAAVVAHEPTVAALAGPNRKLAGIDMENYGLYYAAANSGESHPPRWCAVKSVVDFADAQKGDLYHHYGAHMAARFARWLIEHAVVPEVGR